MNTKTQSNSRQTTVAVLRQQFPDMSEIGRVDADALGEYGAIHLGGYIHNELIRVLDRMGWFAKAYNAETFLAWPNE